MLLCCHPSWPTCCLVALQFEPSSLVINERDFLGCDYYWSYWQSSLPKTLLDHVTDTGLLSYMCLSVTYSSWGSWVLRCDVFKERLDISFQPHLGGSISGVGSDLLMWLWRPEGHNDVMMNVVLRAVWRWTSPPEVCLCLEDRQFRAATVPIIHLPHQTSCSLSEFCFWRCTSVLFMWPGSQADLYPEIFRACLCLKQWVSRWDEHVD